MAKSVVWWLDVFRRSSALTPGGGLLQRAGGGLGGGGVGRCWASAGARSPRSETWRRSAATAARRRRCARQADGEVHRFFAAPGRVTTWRRTARARETCSSSWPSCASPKLPRVLTASRCFKSPTPWAGVCISPRPFVHLLQPLGHLLEALARALLQRGVQLLVDGLAHPSSLRCWPPGRSIQAAPAWRAPPACGGRWLR